MHKPEPQGLPGRELGIHEGRRGRQEKAAVGSSGQRKVLPIGTTVQNGYMVLGYVNKKLTIHMPICQYIQCNVALFNLTYTVDIA